MFKFLKRLFFIYILSFPLYFSYLVVFTPFQVSDLFSERISLLRDRPKNIEKDIVVDLTKIGDAGGMATYAEGIMKYMIEVRPNYRWIILHQCEAYGNKDFKSFLNDYKESHNNLVMVNVNSKCDFLFKWLYFIAKSQAFIKIDEVFSKWLSNQSVEFNDTFYRFKQLFLHGKLFADRHCDLMFSLATPACSFGYGIPQVSVIHDVIHLDAPAIVSTMSSLNHKRAFPNNFNTSTKLISISNFTKHCIMKYFANIDQGKIEVIRTQMAWRLPDISVEGLEQTLKKFGLKRDKYFVFPSRFWSHKNHSGLAAAFAKMLKENEVDPEFKLVFMGGYKNNKGSLMKTAKRAIDTIKECKIVDRVVFTGYTTNEEFRSILEGSLAVVNPTFYEGFGMPIAEAMLQKKPVVCSRIASLPEVGGDAALYFDPFDIDDMASKLYQVYCNADLRKIMIEKGNEQVKNFTNQEKMLGDMVKLLDNVMAETKPEDKYKINWDFCYIK